MLDFRLRVFHSVAHNLSFTKAANELCITQPAVTKHIKELESEFELKLFERKGNKISLTPAGIILHSYANTIVSLHNALKIELADLSGQHSGELRIGASSTIAQYVIPSALASFNERYPEIKISLLSGNSQYIESCLLEQEIDLGIVEGRATNSDLKYSPFLNDELLIFTSAKNKGAKHVISVDEFLSLPLVLRERGSGTLEIIENKLMEKQIRTNQLHVLMYLGSTEAIKSFVRSGDGVGIVSRFAIEQDLQQSIFKVIEPKGLKFERQFFFIYPQGPEPSGLAKLFFNFLHKHYNLKL